MTTPILIRRRAEGVSDPMRVISNSEVSAFTQCERKHYYAHLRNLEPVRTSTSLSRGIIGHEALADYYTALQEGQPFEKAQQAAIMAVHKYIGTGVADDTMLMELLQLITRYTACYPHDEFREILAVERAYGLPVTDEFEYGMRLDLLVRMIDGSVVIIDHKFVYDFYTDDVISMNAQMPKYIGTVRFNGMPVDYGILNQVRHRLKKSGNTDEETFRRVVVKPPQIEIRNILGEQFEVSQRIIERRALSPDMQSRKAVRTMNQMTCRNCSFLTLCKSELQGGDITLAVESQFRTNSYTYNPEDE